MAGFPAGGDDGHQRSADGAELALHPFVESRHADNHTLMGAAADRLEIIVGFDAECHGAAFELQYFGGRRDPQADRGRRGVADVKLDAEALLTRGRRCSIAANAAASITLIMTGVASTAIRPEPTKGAVCSGPTTSSAVPVRPGLIRARTSLTCALEVIAAI